MRSFADSLGQQPSVHREINTTGGGKTSFESRHLCTQSKIYILNIAAPRPGSLSVYKSYSHVYVLSQQALKRPPDNYERLESWVAKCSSLGHPPPSAWKVSWCKKGEEIADFNMIFHPDGHFCIHFKRNLKPCYCDLKVTANKPDPFHEQCVLWRYGGGVCLPGPRYLQGLVRPTCGPSRPTWQTRSARQFSSVHLGRAWSSRPCPDLHLHGGVCRRDSWGAIAVPATKTHKELQCW